MKAKKYLKDQSKSFKRVIGSEFTNEFTKIQWLKNESKKDSDLEEIKSQG